MSHMSETLSTDVTMTDEVRVMQRRTFLKRVMAITGCSAIGLLLDACGSSATVAPTTAAAPTAAPVVPTTAATAAATTEAATTQPTVAATTTSATTAPTTAATAATMAEAGAAPSGGPPAGGGGPGGGETEALAEAFKGLTTDGNVISDLYTIKSTGVSTESIVTAATTFLASLTEEQRASTLFAVDDDEWRKWSNVDGYTRQGVGLEAMTEAQRTAAMNLLGAALSAKGLETAQNIMKLNLTEGELLGETSRFNELLYWFTIMGEPSATEPWGFQLDGHHLIINYFILGDQVVMAPVFLGAEPPVAPSGTYQGVSVLQDEQNQGLAFAQALTDEQRATAIIEASKTTDNMQAGAFSDNAVVAYAGIKGDALTSEQQTQLLALIGLWVGNMRDAHAAVKMEEVKTHIADTYFAWIGETSDDAVFYYRIQSPVILIEFDHQKPGPLGQNPDYAVDTPTRNHIHAMVRTPNGNDYGKSLLQQHLQAYRHEVTPAGVVHVPVLATAAMGAVAAMLPRERNGVAVSSALMAAGPLVYDAAGQVAWNAIWGHDDPTSPFCDLALTGGPPHRGTLLEPVDLHDVEADPMGYARVVRELVRGLRMVTGLDVVSYAAPGWVGLVCPDEAMSIWMVQAILRENVSVRREGHILFLPASPTFRIDHEIKNVVTVVAKTIHYWLEHRSTDVIAPTISA